MCFLHLHTWYPRQGWLESGVWADCHRGLTNGLIPGVWGSKNSYFDASYHVVIVTNSFPASKVLRGLNQVA